MQAFPEKAMSKLEDYGFIQSRPKGEYHCQQPAVSQAPCTRPLALAARDLHHRYHSLQHTTLMSFHEFTAVSQICPTHEASFARSNCRIKSLMRHEFSTSILWFGIRQSHTSSRFFVSQERQTVTLERFEKIKYFAMRQADSRVVLEARILLSSAHLNHRRLIRLIRLTLRRVLSRC